MWVQKKQIIMSCLIFFLGVAKWVHSSNPSTIFPRPTLRISHFGIVREKSDLTYSTGVTRADLFKNFRSSPATWLSSFDGKTALSLRAAGSFEFNVLFAKGADDLRQLGLLKSSASASLNDVIRKVTIGALSIHLGNRILFSTSTYSPTLSQTKQKTVTSPACDLSSSEKFYTGAATELTFQNHHTIIFGGSFLHDATILASGIFYKGEQVEKIKSIENYDTQLALDEKNRLREWVAGFSYNYTPHPYFHLGINYLFSKFSLPILPKDYLLESTDFAGDWYTGISLTFETRQEGITYYGEGVLFLLPDRFHWMQSVFSETLNDRTAKAFLVGVSSARKSEGSIYLEFFFNEDRIPPFHSARGGGKIGESGMSGGFRWSPFVNSSLSMQCNLVTKIGSAPSPFSALRENYKGGVRLSGNTRIIKTLLLSWETSYLPFVEPTKNEAEEDLIGEPFLGKDKNDNLFTETASSSDGNNALTEEVSLPSTFRMKTALTFNNSLFEFIFSPLFYFNKQQASSKNKFSYDINTIVVTDTSWRVNKSLRWNMRLSLFRSLDAPVTITPKSLPGGRAISQSCQGSGTLLSIGPTMNIRSRFTFSLLYTFIKCKSENARPPEPPQNLPINFKTNEELQFLCTLNF